MNEEEASYPGEIDHDADALAKVVAGIMRSSGTDPHTISGVDAWHTYCDMWHRMVVHSGQQIGPEWATMVGYESPLGVRFIAEWERHRLLNKLVVAGPGEMLNLGGN